MIKSFSAPPFGLLSASSIAIPLVLAGVLTVLADWLFYGHDAGITVAMFLALVVAASVVAAPPQVPKRNQVLALPLAVAGLLPVMEDVNALSLVLALVAIAVICLFIHGKLPASAGSWPKTLTIFAIMVPWRLAIDLFRLLRARRTRHGGNGSGAGLLVWLMPVAATGGFAFLFVMANPVLDDWVNRLIFATPPDGPEPERILFWLLTASFAWPVIKPRLPSAAAATGELRAAEVYGPHKPSVVFGADAITRALVLFNLLFGVQTGLDLYYLWGGAALPDGMTYAQYAHRGAYPLIATALLAGAFVLAALRPGSETSRNRVLRGLVYVWTLQNVFLVVSSLLRLDLYVAHYALTYWRVAAFIWMVLVALGLLLILARIRFERSSSWLIGANAVSLALVLYAASLVNWPYIIADFNVTHSRDMGGSGVTLDCRYLVGLGPQALPAIDQVIARHGTSYTCRNGYRISRSVHLHRRHARQWQDWRQWSWRRARLQGYLDTVTIADVGKSVSHESPRAAHTP